MKKNVILILTGILFCFTFVQCKSKEDKALAIIKEHFFRTMPDFNSYQPIETSFDSAFHTPYNDRKVLLYAKFCIEALNDIKTYQKLGIEDLVNISCETYENYTDSIIIAATNMQPHFIGWKVTHKFRSKTIDGTSELSTRYFIMDNNFNKILVDYGKDDDEYKFISTILPDKDWDYWYDIEHNIKYEL